MPEDSNSDSPSAQANPWRAVALATLALTLLGYVLIATAGDAPTARRFGQTPEVRAQRQTLGLGIGAAAWLLIFALGRARALRCAPWLLLSALALTGATLLPGVGVRSGGAWRHVDLVLLAGQPSILLAALTPAGLAVGTGGGRRRWPLWCLLVLGGAILLRQPNFGHLGTLLATATATLWGLGRRARRQAWGVSLLLAATPLVALAFPYVRWRLRSFLNPGLTRDTQALSAIRAGAGLLGRGLGQGWEKGRLSAPPTDYLFSVTLEELGWLGAAGALGLLLALALSLLAAARQSKRPLARSLLLGTAAFLLAPGLVHVAVCLRLLPVTGIHFPLLSHSGSAVLAIALALAFAKLADSERAPAKLSA